ncbi:hypothetical protein SYNTR_1192 [Candidatus Syntrophocurvum alkaliphilum]|uniref:Uncharacterized protein n=1 Tax=Candidatus Syntrophocurvum alkaliphilum TaxID=2293317 RepID=A0A6I6DAP6_9FIRM|nr:hypothetical protein SYNTR_1192 [Candidatus Syntrophocurvum alkaliphilum]
MKEMKKILPLNVTTKIMKGCEKKMSIILMFIHAIKII